MKETFIQLKKLAVRGFMAVGALLGLTSCPMGPQPCVYGPPPGIDSIMDSINVVKVVYGPPPAFKQDSVQPIEDVYGPPVETPDDEDIHESAEEQ
jgi:hypothetical protein